MTVNEVSKISGVSVRTLHYYDEIGLLRPKSIAENGYRQYDEESVARLQRIMLFRELEFPLADIRRILDAPGLDMKAILSDQVKLLLLKREHIDGIIKFAGEIMNKEETDMSFKAFDRSKIEEYSAEVKKRWGNTDAYREFEARNANDSDAVTDEKARGLMQVFARFGELRGMEPSDTEVQETVVRLRDYITANYYTCTKEILRGLGEMYSAGGEMTDNIDTYAGTGTAEFASAAIKLFCK